MTTTKAGRAATWHALQAAYDMAQVMKHANWIKVERVPQPVPTHGQVYNSRSFPYAKQRIKHGASVSGTEVAAMPDKQDPPPVTAVNEGGPSPYVLLCEHASNHIPAEYAGLGLQGPDLRRHIAWDIGAADLARLLSQQLDAPLFLSGYSRLLIDCNRPLLTPTSIPTRSEDTEIPGNHGLTVDERGRRAAAYFTPFHNRVAATLDRRARAAAPTIVVGVHSFTPVFRGVARPWQCGVLYAAAAGFGQALIARLAADPRLNVGDNQPYQIAAAEDYTVPVHGDQRGLPAALIEVRQDLLATPKGIKEWAQRLAPALAGVAAGFRATSRPTGC